MGVAILPDVWCPRCEVEWLSAYSSRCWVCDREGHRRRAASTQEEKADEILLRLRRHIAHR